jgi:hypothetical protein
MLTQDKFATGACYYADTCNALDIIYRLAIVEEAKFRKLALLPLSDKRKALFSV